VGRGSTLFIDAPTPAPSAMHSAEVRRGRRNGIGLLKRPRCRNLGQSQGAGLAKSRECPGTWHVPLLVTCRASRRVPPI
jgi:hypothetical protein